MISHASRLVIWLCEIDHAGGRAGDVAGRVLPSGSTSSRSVPTKAVVCTSCGRVVGMTLNTAVVPAELTEAGVTDATPAVLAMSDCMVDSSELFAELD